MIFPYGTDARFRYWPYTTVTLIAICSLVFLAELISPKVGFALSLDIGNGLRPYQWITANLVHVEFGHLLWNMLALWVFGLVVEGKLGWSRSLAVYLAIRVAPCAVDQLLFLGAKAGVFLRCVGDRLRHDGHERGLDAGERRSLCMGMVVRPSIRHSHQRARNRDRRNTAWSCHRGEICPKHRVLHFVAQPQGSASQPGC